MNDQKNVQDQCNRQQQFARNLLARSGLAASEFSPEAAAPEKEIAPTPCDIVNRAELASRLNLNVRTINRMVDRGELPEPCLSRGGRPRWLWKYVLEFLDKRHRRLSDLNRRKELKTNTQTVVDGSATRSL